MEIRQRTWGKFTDEQWAAIKKLDSEMDICSLDLSTQGEMVRAHVVTPQGEEVFLISEEGLVVISPDRVMMGRVLVGFKDTQNRPRWERKALEKEIERIFQERFPGLMASVQVGRSSYFACNYVADKDVPAITKLRNQIEEDLDAIGEKSNTSLEQ